jgi:hypothetical protein
MNSPLWFLLADIHLSDKTLPHLTPFFDFLLSQFSQHKPTHILFLGDTFNVRRATDPVHHRIFTDLLRTLISAPWDPQVHLLVGNQYLPISVFPRTEVNRERRVTVT